MKLRAFFGWRRRDDEKLDAILHTLRAFGAVQSATLNILSRLERKMADVETSLTNLEATDAKLAAELGKIADLVRSGGDRAKLAARLDALAGRSQAAIDSVADIDPPTA